MTYNQLLLNQHLENQRSNLANEAIKRFSAQSEHAYRVGSLNEQIRHNLQTEDVASGNLAELIRHNKATEGYNVLSLNELSRHNLATESAQIQSILESVRHNKATEGLGYGNLAALISHNQATENLQSLNYEELNRHNVSSEYENWRHNEAMEDIQQEQATASNIASLGSWAAPLINLLGKLL